LYKHTEQWWKDIYLQEFMQREQSKGQATQAKNLTNVWQWWMMTSTNQWWLGNEWKAQNEWTKETKNKKEKWS